MPSKPKAHINFSRGSTAAARPGCGTKPELQAAVPQFIHVGPRVGSAVGVGAVPRFAVGFPLTLICAGAGACDGCPVTPRPTVRKIANTILTYRSGPPVNCAP